MEQVVTEIYRTNENKALYTFTSCVTLTYFGKTVFVQGLSGTFTVACFRELECYLKSKGMKEVQYYRKDRQKRKEL